MTGPTPKCDLLFRFFRRKEKAREHMSGPAIADDVLQVGHCLTECKKSNRIGVLRSMAMATSFHHAGLNYGGAGIFGSVGRECIQEKQHEY